MTPTETAAKLRQFNEWRRGDDEAIEQPDPREIGEAIDAAIAMIDRLEAAESDALEQARLNGMGSEREAALMAKLEAAEKERDALRSKNHQYQVRLRKILEEPENTMSNSKALAEVIRQARIALGVKK